MAFPLLHGRFHTKICHTIQKTEVTFNVPNRYIILGDLNVEGGEACVVHAHDRVTHKNVAIKKRRNPFSPKNLARRTHREFVLSQMVNHVNVTKLMNAFTPSDKFDTFNEVYFVTEFVTYPLAYLIAKGIFKEGEFVSYVVYQILCGVKHLHKTGIVHRDLSTSNIMLNQDLSLKIIDLGLARQIPEDVPQLSSYVCTRPYRAPEIILQIIYDKKVDIWSVGCIFAQILLGKPLFYAQNELSMWYMMLDTLGSPPASFTGRNDIPEEVKNFILSKPGCTGQSWEEIFPDDKFPPKKEVGKRPLCTAEYGRDLLSRMLRIDPNQRISAEEALYHPYVMWDESGGEIDTDTNPFGKNNGFIESIDHSEDVWKAVIYAEIKQYERDNNIFGTMIPGFDQSCEICQKNRCDCPACVGLKLSISSP